MTGRPEPIAIIGMGLRFPGAQSPGQFWELLRDGRDEFREAPEERGMPGARGGFLDEVAGFDWRAFRIPPREVRQMDPQHRLLLLASWNAFEDASLPFEEVRNTHASVFVGLNFNDYHSLLTSDCARIDGYTVLGNVPAFAANRISYTFGLRGQSLSLNAACASSLAAVHHGCQSLRTGESSLALAAGAELILSPANTTMLSQAGVLSPTGRCTALDARADGYLRGEGAAAILLRRLSDVRPGERVYAVICGSALNHNGHNEWLMATSAGAQDEVVRECCERTGIDRTTVDYVELHGSALPKGDAAEIRAVGSALGGPRREPCRIGTVTNNIGYLGAAGGMAGVIKVALSLHHKQLPRTIHVDTTPAEVSLEELNLRVQRVHEEWPSAAGPRHGGVLSTSLGGANAFVILSSADKPAARPARHQQQGEMRVLPLSGHSVEALRDRVRDFRAFLLSASADDSALYGICYTAAAGRTHHPHRVGFAGTSREELVAEMDAWLEGRETRSTEVTASYAAGNDAAWKAVYPDGGGYVDLPIYPFQLERFWPEWLTLQEPAPEETSNSTIQPPDILQFLRNTGDSQRSEALLRHVQSVVLELLGMDPSKPLPAGQRLFDLGLNSMLIMQLKSRLEADLAVAMPISVFFEHGTLEALSDYLLRCVQGEVSHETVGEARPVKLRKQVEELTESEAEFRLIEKLRELEMRL